MDNLYEAEIKIELISSHEVDRVKNLLSTLNFDFVASHSLQEYYITKTVSPLGGWDFERLRGIDDETFLRTIKKWTQDQNGHAVRLEDEHAISQDEFNRIISKDFDLHYVKNREDFKGIIADNNSTISIDTLALDGKERYFFECEVIVSQDKAHGSRELLKQWVTKNLAIDTTVEAPSMIDIVTNF
jgi:hypothetical protein